MASLLFTNLCLSVVPAYLRAEIEASRVHRPGCLLHLYFDPSEVTLGGHLHLTELSAEGHDSTPETEQTRVFRVAIVVE